MRVLTEHDDDLCWDPDADAMCIDCITEDEDVRALQEAEGDIS
jgi:hypothetical protein